MKHKIHSFLIGMVVFFMSISPAFAAGTAFALGLASTMADIALNYYIGTQEQRATALSQLNKFWADSGSGGSIHATFVTYQSLSDLCLELNENGFPCAITPWPTTSSTNGDYCIRGNGDVVVPGVIPTTSNRYSIDGRILHTANGALYPILAKDPNQDSLAYKPIYDKLKDIYNYYTQTLTTKLNSIISYVDGMEGYVDGIEGYVDGIEGYVDGVESKLDSVISNTSNIYTRLGDILSVVRKNYYFGYKSDTNNVDYPTIPISWETANSICSYLNNNFNHDGTINYISVSNQVGAQYTFYHARVAASGYIVVNVYEGGTAHDFVVCDRNHNCYMASDATSYDHISASLTSIIGYIDGVESTLSTISSRINTTNTRLNTVSSTLTSISNKLDNIDSADPIDYSSVLSQIAGNTDEDIYVTLYTSDSNGNSYSTVSYRPEIIDGLVSYINTHLANKPLKVLYRDGQDGQVADVVRNMMFVDFTSTGYVRLRVMWNNNSYGYAYLSSPSHVLVKQDNTYVDDSTFYQKLSDIESALFGTVETRSTALVPIGESMLDVVSNGTTIISNVVALSSPIGLIKTGVDTIVDLIEAFDEEPDYTTVLNNINNALRVTVDGDTYTVAQLESISAQHLNNIEEWLTAADLLDNQTITTIVNSYGSDIVDGVTKSSKFIQLYQKAFGSLRSYGIDDDYTWNSIYDYFDTFYGGGAQ